MNTSKNNGKHNPAHPGEVLREWLPEHLTVTEAAAQLKISRVMFSKILNAKAGITAEIALRLAAWLGTTPNHWLEMQMQYDLLQAKQQKRMEILPLALAA